MKAVILAGGYGTRFNGAAGRPKPLALIGNDPLLWHVIRVLGCQGITECIIALGHAADAIKTYFLQHRLFHTSSEIRPTDDAVTVTVKEPFTGTIQLVDTGLDTMTGGRLKRLRRMLQGEECFLMTYADGLADIDIKALFDFHRSHGRLATVTAVRPPERFGRLGLDGDRVVMFNEKKAAPDEWINGGFFVLHPKAIGRIAGSATTWEEEPLQGLAADRELMGYRHTGFWACMDTLKEKAYLEQLWQTGSPPWKLW